MVFAIVVDAHKYLQRSSLLAGRFRLTDPGTAESSTVFTPAGEPRVLSQPTLDVIFSKSCRARRIASRQCASPDTRCLRSRSR